MYWFSFIINFFSSCDNSLVIWRALILELDSWLWRFQAWHFWPSSNEKRRSHNREQLIKHLICSATKHFDLDSFSAFHDSLFPLSPATLLYIIRCCCSVMEISLCLNCSILKLRKANLVEQIGSPGNPTKLSWFYWQVVWQTRLIDEPVIDGSFLS